MLFFLRNFAHCYRAYCKASPSLPVDIQLKIIHLKKSMHLVSALLVGDLLQMQKLYGGTQWCQVHISGRRGPRLLSLAKGEETLCGVFLVSTLFYIPNLYIIVCTSVWVEKNNNHYFRDRSSPMDCRSPILSVKPCAWSRVLHLETRYVHA